MSSNPATPVAALSFLSPLTAVFMLMLAKFWDKANVENRRRLHCCFPDACRRKRGGTSARRCCCQIHCPARRRVLQAAARELMANRTSSAVRRDYSGRHHYIRGNGGGRNMSERFERHRQPWRQDEIQKLHQLAGKGMSVRAIAKALTRSEESVKDRAKADRLKIAKLR